MSVVQTTLIQLQYCGQSPFLYALDATQLYKVIQSIAHFPALLHRVVTDPKLSPPVLNRVYAHVIQNDQWQMAKIMLENPLVHPGSVNNKTLFMAVLKEDEEMVRRLLRDPRAINPLDHGQSAIRAAVQANSVRMLALLLGDPRIDPSYRHCEILQNAVKHNASPELLRVLLADRRIDPGASDQLAIRSARRPETIQVLLQDPRVDPTTRNDAPLVDAITYGGPKCVECLLRDPRVNPTRALIDAARWRVTNIKTVQLVLLDPRTDIGQVFQDVWSLKLAHSNLQRVVALAVWDLISCRLPVPRRQTQAAVVEIESGLEKETQTIITTAQALREEDDTGDTPCLALLMLENVLLEETLLRQRIFDQTVQRMFAE